MIRVLVVDDEPVVADAHASYLGRLDGFVTAGIAHSAGQAMTFLTEQVTAGAPVDLVLLDLTLPDAGGLDLARRLRATRIDADIIAITAVRDLESVQAAMAVGAFHYLIKPFGFAAFRERLEEYAHYRHQLADTGSATTQQDVDDLLATLRSPRRTALPKGLTAATLESVSSEVRAHAGGYSASELAEHLQLSRVTARRYLEHLADLGLATRAPRYGSPGRPEVGYTWRG